MKGMKCFVYLVILIFSLGAYAIESAAQNLIATCADDPGAPGSYMLTANLSSSGNCLEVGAANVTIDLNGFQIEKTAGGGLTAGIKFLNSLLDTQGITVRNGTIKGFSFGINLSGGRSCLVENISARDNTSAGIRVDSGCTVRNNIAVDNLGSGIVASEANIISGNTAYSNDLDGIDVGSDNLISNNNASLNARDGISTNGFGFQNLISGNTTSGNGQDGIQIDCPSNLTGNIAQGNGVMNVNLIGLGCKRFGDNLF